MVIERWTGPPVETHTYLVADEETGEAWVIDAPLDTAAAVLARCRERGFTLTRAILTHAHFDHILDAGAYEQAGIPLYLHAGDLPLLAAPQTALFGLDLEMPAVSAPRELREGDRLSLGGTEWEVRHTPGHSPGHAILYSPAEGTVLGGDLLFQGGYGRVDLPGSSPAAMRESLRRLMELPRETRVYPGHGPDTTLGKERAWLRDLLAAGAL